MRRLTFVVLALCLSACYTSLKQTRAPVSADCNLWPQPVADGDRLVLRLGEVGRFGELKILFADLDLNEGGHRYYYPPHWSPYPIGPWYHRAHHVWPPYVEPGWWGPVYPLRSPLVDVVYLSICSGEGTPTDRKFRLSRSSWFTDDTARLGPYTIQIDRLRLEDPTEDAPADSVAAKDYWRRMKSRGVVTLIVSRDS